MVTLQELISRFTEFYDSDHHLRINHFGEIEIYSYSNNQCLEWFKNESEFLEFLDDKKERLEVIKLEMSRLDRTFTTEELKVIFSKLGIS